MTRINIHIPDRWHDLSASQAAQLQKAHADYAQDGQYPDYVAKAAYILSAGQIVPGEFHMLPGPDQMQIQDALDAFIAEEQQIVTAGSLPKSFAGYPVPQSQTDFLESTGTKFWADMATFFASLENKSDVATYDSAIYACAAWLVSRKYGQPNAMLESQAIEAVEKMPAGEVLPVGFFLAIASMLLLSNWPESQTQLKQSLAALLATLPSSER